MMTLTSGKALFRVPNMLVNKVTGTIGIDSAVVEVDTSGQPTGGHAILNAATIATGNTRRDKDLRSRRFLDTGSYPHLSYRAVTVTPVAAGWRVTGYLTVAGQDAPVTLDVTAVPDGSSWRVRATGRLDRHDTTMRKVPSFMIGRRIDIEIDAVLTTG